MKYKECHFCGQRWEKYEFPKCKCYQRIEVGTMVKCSLKGARYDMQLCYVCPVFDDCEDRENAQLELLKED